jgi:hypothetical protein
LAFRHQARFQVPKTPWLFICSHASARPLREQTHGEREYCPLQFQKRSQQFIGAHNETLSVAAFVT